MGFQNANENDFNGFGNLLIWLCKSYENISKGVCANPGIPYCRLQQLRVHFCLACDPLHVCFYKKHVSQKDEAGNRQKLRNI